MWCQRWRLFCVGLNVLNAGVWEEKNEWVRNNLIIKQTSKHKHIIWTSHNGKMQNDFSSAQICFSQICFSHLLIFFRLICNMWCFRMKPLMSGNKTWFLGWQDLKFTRILLSYSPGEWADSQGLGINLDFFWLNLNLIPKINLLCEYSFPFPQGSEQSTLKNLSSTASNLHFCLQEQLRIVKLFWFSQLPQRDQHGNFVDAKMLQEVSRTWWQ